MAVAPLNPPGPFPLTAAQAEWLGRPPKPLEPSVPAYMDNGLPTQHQALYLSLRYEWERRLYAVLTGVN